METTKNIILVDDHIIIRNGLKELIQKIGPYQITAEFDNGAEFVNTFPPPAHTHLVILDVSMPEMDGDEVLDIMKERNIDIPVLILTLSQDEDRMVRLFRKGVRGCLQKNCTASMMKNALHEIFEYGYYHNELLKQALQKDSMPAKKNEQELILERLSAREKEFLKLICHQDEYTYDQIADIMSVQHRTVDGYRESIFEKFGIRSKTGLVLFILRHNLFSHLSS